MVSEASACRGVPTSHILGTGKFKVGCSPSARLGGVPRNLAVPQVVPQVPSRRPVTAGTFGTLHPWLSDSAAQRAPCRRRCSTTVCHRGYGISEQRTRKAVMHPDAVHQLLTQLDGQTSINDYLTPIPAIIPVELREPTDAELANFLTAETL